LRRQLVQGACVIAPSAPTDTESSSLLLFGALGKINWCEHVLPSTRIHEFQTAHAPHVIIASDKALSQKCPLN
jgi:hypothetical protein